MSKYNELLRERATEHILDLYRLDLNNKYRWESWSRLLSVEPSMSDETLEAICEELAVQFLVFSKRRPSHYPLLSAFEDRDDAIAEERAAMARMKAGCAE